MRLDAEPLSRSVTLCVACKVFMLKEAIECLSLDSLSCKFDCFTFLSLVRILLAVFVTLLLAAQSSDMDSTLSLKLLLSTIVDLDLMDFAEELDDDDKDEDDDDE